MQAALALVLGLTYAIGALTIPLLLAIVVFLAVLYDFTEAADETTTRLLFGRDHLFIVSGIAGAIGGGASITLYFTAGATLALFGAIGGAFLLAGLLAAGTGLAVPLPIPTPRTTSQTWWNGLREGWALFRGTEGKPLRQLGVQQFVVGFFLASPTLLLTLYVGQFFQGSQATYAAFYVAYLIGGIVIGLVLGHANPRGSIGAVTIGSMFVIGLALLGSEIAIASVSAITVVWFVVGAASTARNQSTWTYLQGRFEPQMLARVSMNIYLFTGVSSAIGAFAIGVLSAAWSPQDQMRAEPEHAINTLSPTRRVACASRKMRPSPRIAPTPHLSCAAAIPSARAGRARVASCEHLPPIRALLRRHPSTRIRRRGGRALRKSHRRGPSR